MSGEKHLVESGESSPVEAREEGVGVPNNERKLMRKIDLRLLPGLTLLFLLSWLDQGNGKLSSFSPLPTFSSFSLSRKCSY